MIFIKREKKSALSRQRILDAALEEFSHYGYMAASLNRVCQEKDISKGMIYHYFKDKDEIYLICIKDCFEKLTDYIKENYREADLPIEDLLKKYFDTRMEFFSKNPLYLGIFLDLVLNTPDHLRDEILEIRNGFDSLNISIFRSMLENVDLREGLSLDNLVEDFRLYMNFFNLVFKDMLKKEISQEDAFKEHEKRIHRQLEIILYGILKDGK